MSAKESGDGRSLKVQKCPVRPHVSSGLVLVRQVDLRRRSVWPAPSRLGVRRGLEFVAHHPRERTLILPCARIVPRLRIFRRLGSMNNHRSAGICNRGTST